MFVIKSTQLDFPAAEEKTLEFWKKNGTFEKSVALRQTQGKPRFVFYEGPPTANGRPGIHHVLARSFKDIILRYKTMQGFFVPRRGGWDTHGLPVEIEVERELGLKSKKDIEKFGIAEFNKKCKESVWKYKEEWERLTERMGFWLDLKNPYITYETNYIETLWWIIKEIWKKKLLYKGHKVVPWCPRCGTALSSHELAQGYKEVTDNSVYVKFKLKKGKKIGDFTTDDKTYILSWTTTPWTLPGNVALAVGKDIHYGIYENKTNIRRGMSGGGEWILTEGHYILATNLLSVLTKEGNYLTGRSILVSGKELVGLEYEPLFKIPTLVNKNSYKVYPADFVTTEEGTGVVHTAVMYGEDDYELGKKVGLPQHHTVDEQGKFMKEVPSLGGLFVKSTETEKKIFRHLEKNRNLLKIESYTHEYPFCWRCETPVLYYARDSWFVAMSKLKTKLLAANKKINWIPSYLRDGRFGEWLREVKDWNFSRERYWGTPLPIWECKRCGAQDIFGSFEELGRRAGNGNTFYILRHGESQHNLEGICGPPRDTDKYTSHLTEFGKKQIKAAARILLSKKIDFIFISSLKRARETAEIVAKYIKAPIQVADEIRELHPGIFEGKNYLEYRDYFANLASGIDKFTHAPQGGESKLHVRKRMLGFYQDLNRRYRGKNILLISHGDPLWILRSALRGLDVRGTIAQKKAIYPETGKVYEASGAMLSFTPEGEFDPHRPYIDAVQFPCAKCKGEMRRIPEVADAWFDSGSVPFAQVHYPFSKGHKLEYPANYISEGIDQTRGWFYTLLAVGTLLGKGTPYKNVISLGHVNDKYGNKMSKSKGNVVDPWTMIEKYGVDVVRWYFFTSTPPGEPKNFDEADLGKAFRRFHLILWNSLVFYRTYGRGIKSDVKPVSKNILDRWVLVRLAETIAEATRYLDKYHVREAALALEQFVDDLSRWYIRRSRRRFQPARRSLDGGGKPESKKDFADASSTLAYVLGAVSKLAAPFTPFFSEILWNELGGKESVHLTNWPVMKKETAHKKLNAAMEEVRRIASVALAKRAEAGIKVRQPLRRLTVKGKGVGRELAAILADEVNVKEIVFNPKLKTDLELDTAITPELKEEGIVREIVRMAQDLRQKAGFKPKDAIVLMAELSGGLKSVFQKNEKLIKQEIGAKEVEYKKSEKFKAEIATKFDEVDIWMAVREV
ncbi:MAG: class I tRNA ligase family protein [Candidatus Liptonbacteria bacterium]|nr:class I tRNA ligase family protein [Candidatus Liptonbacteria bacterium]